MTKDTVIEPQVYRLNNNSRAVFFKCNIKKSLCLVLISAAKSKKQRMSIYKA